MFIFILTTDHFKGHKQYEQKLNGDICYGMELAYLGKYIKVEVECTVKVVFSLSFAISTFPISRDLDFRAKKI